MNDERVAADTLYVVIVTEAATEQVELEITDATRIGQVHIPHVFGLRYLGDVHGINVNRLTKNTHRYVPCRVEKIGSECK